MLTACCAGNQIPTITIDAISSHAPNVPDRKRRKLHSTGQVVINSVCPIVNSAMPTL